MKSKTSRHWHPIGVAAMVLCVTVSCASTSDDDYSYVSTDLDDPLQPVWDTLDRLPSEVSEAVMRTIGIQFRLINTQVSTKLQSLTHVMATVTGALQRLEQSTQSAPGNNETYQQLLHLQNTILDNLVTKLEVHINSQMEALETKLKAHIDAKLSPAASTSAVGGGLETRGSEVDASIAQTLSANTRALENITTHVLKINEKIGGSSESGDSCTTLLDKVTELMDGSVGASSVCPVENQRTAPSALPRDCSDIHWVQPEGPSGVYETFPTFDNKAPVNCYCDMGQPGAKDTGGWTVILRRRNTTYGLVNFNRTWTEYRTGFGDPGEGEWWFGLSSLHALTYRQPYEVDLLLHDIEKGTFHAQYTTFRVEDEAHAYKLILGGFSGNLTHDALTSKHNGSPFSTWDKDNDSWGSGNCGQSNGGGWWFNNCHFTTLTAPFPTSANRNARTIRWLEDDWLVLDDVTLKIRPFNYAERFNVHTLG